MRPTRNLLIDRMKLLDVEWVEVCGGIFKLKNNVYFLVNIDHLSLEYKRGSIQGFVVMYYDNKSLNDIIETIKYDIMRLT